jgi:hypothetical protein
MILQMLPQPGVASAPPASAPPTPQALQQPVARAAARRHLAAPRLRLTATIAITAVPSYRRTAVLPYCLVAPRGAYLQEDEAYRSLWRRSVEVMALTAEAQGQRGGMKSGRLGGGTAA